MAGVERFILEILSTMERSLTRGEFPAITEGFQKIADRLKPLRLANIDALEFDARTHLFTALLRAGRLSPAKDEEGESLRREMLSSVGNTWLAVGDEVRADEVLDAAGRPERAMARLERSGEWQQAAELAERVGRFSQAAQILKAHGEKHRALELFLRAGERHEALRISLELGLHEKVRDLAREVDFKTVRALLFQNGMADLYLELVAEMGDWREVAHLYEQAGQHGDAAHAYERSGNLDKAVEAFRRAGQQDEVQRLARQAALLRQEKGDLAGAGNVLCRFGLIDEAIDLVSASRPELAFKWIERAGQIERARAFAEEMVERLDAGEEPLLCAIWLERSDQKARAAELWRSLGKPEEALRLYVSLCDWRHAAELAQELGDIGRATEFYARAGIAFNEQSSPEDQAPNIPLSLTDPTLPPASRTSLTQDTSHDCDEASKNRPPDQMPIHTSRENNVQTPTEHLPSLDASGTSKNEFPSTFQEKNLPKERQDDEVYNNESPDHGACPSSGSEGISISIQAPEQADSTAPSNHPDETSNH